MLGWLLILVPAGGRCEELGIPLTGVPGDVGWQAYLSFVTLTLFD